MHYGNNKHKTCQLKIVSLQKKLCDIFIDNYHAPTFNSSSHIPTSYHEIIFDKKTQPRWRQRTFSKIESRSDSVFDLNSGHWAAHWRHNTTVTELNSSERLMKYVGEPVHKEEVSLLCCPARQKPSLYMWADKRAVIKTRPPFSSGSPKCFFRRLNVSGRGAERMRSLKDSSLSDECFDSRGAPRLLLLDNTERPRNF